MTSFERIAASFGGAGFLERKRSHADDIACGVWARCGVVNEFAALREVLLALPGDEVEVEDPDAALMLERVSASRMREQAYALAAIYEAHGVRVHWTRPRLAPQPNYIFQRDLFVMTPEGAMLARPASEQRSKEARDAQEALALLGVPILGMPRGHAHLEGADVLWISARRALVGVGRRTNVAGADFVRAQLSPLGVEVIIAEVPAEVQHLLGAINFVDDHLAVVNANVATPAMHELLRKLEIERIDVGGEEVSVRRAMNFVALGPRSVVMPAHCPKTREALERRGVRCVECEVGEYIRAAGAIGCATGILRRE